MLYRLRWRPVIKPIKIPIRLHSSAFNQLRSDIQTFDVAELPSAWDAALRMDQRDALMLRYDIYRRLRGAGSIGDHDWTLAIMGSIPRAHVRLADYQFAAEVLVHNEQWSDLAKLFTDLALAQPTFWQELFLWLLTLADASLQAEFILETLAVSCVRMGLQLEELALNADQPIFEMLKLLEARFEPGAIVDALSRIATQNMVIAAPLATSLLSTKCDIEMQGSRPPDPLTHVGRPLKDDLAQLLWSWKSTRALATPHDLHLYMLYLVYRRRPRDALSVYDKCSKLHDASQSDALLIAAAVDSDFARLQHTFEAVENDPSVVVKMGSRRYSTVLQALGYLGNADVLEDVYQRLLTKDPALVSRGVFHALIHSHGVRGDLKRTREYYDTMMNRGIEPSPNTFKLVLKAYKDAKDLRGALQFVGDEMVAKHQFGLGNAELTLLLSLCATRHDARTAEYIWTWGSSLCKPDQISWNARLHCYAEANELDAAWALFEEMQAIYKPRIDTLTVLLQGAARFSARAYVQRVTRLKQDLQLRGDEAWYVAVLQYYSRLDDLEMFEATMAEMRVVGESLNASHYAIYSELLARTKNFEKAKTLPAQMAKGRVPVTHAFIGKHLRMLTATGSSAESLLSAEQTVRQHIEDGYFDPRAAMVPRGEIPVSNVKPIVRRLIKQKNLVSAKQLLDSLRTARGAEKPLDSYQLWALYIELAHAAKKYEAIDKLWEQFMRDLARVYVLEQGSAAPGQPPVYKLARRHRHTFWKEVNAKLESMARQGDYKHYASFPAQIEAQGFEMTPNNWNAYVRGLVDLNKIDSAFESAAALYDRLRGRAISGATFLKLSGAVHSVDAAKYGAVGTMARLLAERRHASS